MARRVREARLASPSMRAFPKPRKRIVDPRASAAKRASDPWCRSCRRLGVFVRATNCHHLLGKGQSGDDVLDNLIPICGHGSAGCHGALHGNPYIHPVGGRRTAQDVRRDIGLTLRYPEVAYLVERLGEIPALEHLRAQYGIEVTLRPFQVGPA